jgi:ketosteroid isomerase-like protein
VTAPQYVDEQAIRTLYRRMLDAWGDAQVYAQYFTADADYIYGAGDVAVLLGYGHVVYLDHRSSDENKRTVYTLVAQRLDGRWLFVAYQNTPLGKH